MAVEIEFCAYAQGPGVFNEKALRFDSREVLEFSATTCVGSPVLRDHDDRQRGGVVTRANVVERDGVLELWMRGILSAPAFCDRAQSGIMRSFSISILGIAACSICGVSVGPVPGLKDRCDAHPCGSLQPDGRTAELLYKVAKIPEVSETDSPAVTSARNPTRLLSVQSEDQILDRLTRSAGQLRRELADLGARMNRRPVLAEQQTAAPVELCQYCGAGLGHLDPRVVNQRCPSCRLMSSTSVLRNHAGPLLDVARKVA